MINKKLHRQLESIDWDFATRYTGLTRTPHWYPGTFPAQLPSTLIQALSSSGDVVFDPYGGVGTTAAESIRLNRRTWSVDIHPISALASAPYCALLLLKRVAPKKLELLFALFESVLQGTRPQKESAPLFDFSASDRESLLLDDFCVKHMRPVPEDLLSSLRVGEPMTDLLLRWIHPDTLSEIADFRKLQAGQVIKGCENFFSIFVEFAISANLRALCSQVKSWGHLADNVYPKEMVYKDAIRQLSQWASRLKQSLRRVDMHGGPRIQGIQYWHSVHDWNAEVEPKVRPRAYPRLMLTSPPYGDAIDYLNAQRLSLYFLGYSEDQVGRLCTQEIGARRKRFKPDSRTVWAQDVATAARRQSAYVESGILAIILPHKDHGREMGIEAINRELCEASWTQAFSIDRSISQKSTRQSWTSIKRESITLFSRS